MRRRPICFECSEEVEDPVYEAPCGHEDCPSVCFHSGCLMEYRDERERQKDNREEMFQAVRRFIESHPMFRMMTIPSDEGSGKPEMN